MRILAPSFWMQIVLEHVFGARVVLASDAAGLVRAAADEGPFDAALVGHLALDIPPAEKRALGEHLSTVPTLVFGGWNTFDEGGYRAPELAGVFRARWLGFEQHIFRLTHPEERRLAFPVDDLPPIASLHAIAPLDGGEVILRSRQGATVGVLDEQGPAPRVVLGFPLHPGGGQQLYFDSRYPGFLTALFALVGVTITPRPDATAYAEDLRLASRGALGRVRMQQLVDEPELTPDRLDRNTFTSVLAAEHRYFDIAASIERDMARALDDVRERHFHVARAHQFQGYDMMLHGDMKRAATSFERAAGSWLSRNQPNDDRTFISADFSSSWLAMSAYCGALDLWSRHPGTALARRAIMWSYRRLRATARRPSGHGAIRAMRVIPLGLLVHDILRRLPRPLLWGYFASLWITRSIVVPVVLRGSHQRAGAALFVGLLRDDVGRRTRRVRLVRRGLEIDEALKRGVLSTRMWIGLTSVLGLLLRLDVPARAPQRPRSLFLSYSRVDTDLVEGCHRELVRRGVDAFMDSARLHAGSGLAPILRREAAGASLFVLFVSRASVLDASTWIAMEMEAALSSDIPDFVPVLLEDVRLPALLATRVGIDARALSGAEIAERLAALLSPGAQP